MDDQSWKLTDNAMRWEQHLSFDKTGKMSFKEFHAILVVHSDVDVEAEAAEAAIVYESGKHKMNGSRSGKKKCWKRKR